MSSSGVSTALVRVVGVEREGLRFGEGKGKQEEGRENGSGEVFYGYRNFRHRLAREPTGIFCMIYIYGPGLQDVWVHRGLYVQGGWSVTSALPPAPPPCGLGGRVCMYMHVWVYVCISL